MDGNVGRSLQVPTSSINSYQLDIILAACDVEGNFMVIKVRFSPTQNRLYFSDDQVTSRPTNTPTSFHACSSMRASTFFSYSHKSNTISRFARWAIPVCLFFSWVYMRTKYHWTQLLGVFICICGLGLLVVSDQLTHKDWHAVSRAKGDAFMIAGATLYGFSEFFPVIQTSSPTCDLGSLPKMMLMLPLTCQQPTQLKNSSYASARFTRLVIVPLLHFVLPTFSRSSVNWGCGDLLLMVFRPPRLSGGA
jgi:hypothetical protein